MSTNGISTSMAPTVLTPELAKMLVERVHPRQRRVLQVVDRYAREMRSGNWQLVPDPILIDKATGMLFNGLQRCNAVIKSGASVPVYIDWESDAALFEFIDAGAARRPHHFVSGKYANTKAAAARLILWHERTPDVPISTPSLGFPFGDIVRTAEDWADMFEKYSKISVAINNRLGISGAAMLAACSIADRAGWSDEVDEFLDGLLNPATLTSRDPAWAVFEKYSRRTVRQRSRQIKDDWGIFVRGLNAHINRETLPQQLHISSAVSPRIGETSASLNRRRVSEVNRIRAAAKRVERFPANDEVAIEMAAAAE